MSFLVFALAPLATAQDVSIEPALAAASRPAWEPKGKALESWSRGDTKKDLQAWNEAMTLLVASIQAQPGCGKCLQSLGRALIGAHRYDEAVQVSTHLATLYPDRKEGPYLVGLALSNAHRPAEAAAAWDKLLAVDEANGVGWWDRTTQLLWLDRTDDAEKLLAAKPAAYKDADVACLKVQIALSRGDLAAATAGLTACEASEDLPLRRTTEGLVKLREGLVAEAQNKLAQAGADGENRLALAQVRLSEKKYDAVVNLCTKLATDFPWASDVRLLHAEGLHGLGRDADAAKVLDETILAAGWEARKPARTDVLLFLASASRATDVAREAVALRAAIHDAAGEADKASALRAAGAAAFPAPAEAAPAPEVPAPAPAVPAPPAPN